MLTKEDAIALLADGETIPVIRKIHIALPSRRLRREAVVEIINDARTVVVGLEDSSIGRVLAVKDSGGTLLVKAKE